MFLFLTLIVFLIYTFLAQSFDRKITYFSSNKHYKDLKCCDSDVNIIFIYLKMYMNDHKCCGTNIFLLELYRK